MTEKTRLCVELADGDGIILDGGGATIMIDKKTGVRTRMTIEAPSDVKISRIENNRKREGTEPNGSQ